MAAPADHKCASFEELIADLKIAEGPNKKANKEKAEICFRAFLGCTNATTLDVRGYDIEQLPGAYFLDPRVRNRIEELNCASNKLELLPIELGACPNLKNILLMFNRIAYGAPTAPEKLRERWLNPDHKDTPFEELIADLKIAEGPDKETNKERAINNLGTFLGWENVSILDVRGCDIEWLPGVYFLDPRVRNRIEELNCSSNMLKTLPIELGACPNLKRIEWCYNQIEYGIPTTPEKLRERWLNPDHKDTPFEELIADLKIAEGPDKKANKEKAIRSLGLFLVLEYATDLEVNGYDIEQLPGTYFLDPRIRDRIQKLTCERNKLESLPIELGACPNLKCLRVIFNQLPEGGPITLEHLRSQWLSQNAKSAAKV
jgi:Leucine-rich repeat (LRR) protein